MKTNELAKATLVDDGECVSFHHFSSALDTSFFTYDGFELLVLPEGALDFWVMGQTFSFTGPQVILLGPGLEHGWKNGGREGVAIRWPADLLGEGFLDKHQTQAIAGLLEQAGLAVCFDPVALPSVRQRLEVLRGRAGFSIYLDLLGLLHELSTFRRDPLLRVLPPAPAPAAAAGEKKSAIDEVMAMMQTNYFRPMTLEEMARKACMTKGSFCRSFRRRTGKTYSESLNEIRLGHICRLLSETTDTVSEIAYRAGYQNICHFHRHFKRQKGCTPLEFRAGRR
ncbi:MAG TPA: AraC family transcriptional regulator [Puia sp.]|nr:AraC family transcriptional regulator [Puia sp.]